MVDITIFEDLSKVSGYMGAVLSDYTGEVLVSDTAKIKKLDETSMHFNETFRTIHDLTDNLGLGHAHSMNVEAENALVIMTCSGVESRNHLHAFVIMSKNGSHALAKMALGTMLDKAIVELG